MIHSLTADQLQQTGVYQITNLVNNKCYIGSSRNSFAIRFQRHKTELKHDKHHSSKLQRAYNKYGAANFKVIILEICPAEDCRKREQHYIDSLTPFYNCLLNAGSALGYKHSDEAKAKISAAAKARMLTKEGRANLKPHKIGFKHSDEARAKISKGHKTKKEGFVVSAETRAKISAANKARKLRHS